jgi:hypothetical protein
VLRQAAHDDGARGVRKLLELFEMFVDVVARRRSLTRGADEQRALDRRRDRDQISGDGEAPNRCW